jgi:Protein of unknown function (DUF4031)
MPGGSVPRPAWSRSRRYGGRSLRDVTILVDEPRWWFRGRKWCHLVSDADLDELHVFAERVGMPRRGFQGDHYDIPEEHRAEVVEAGALPVSSRELVQRLRAAGLRLSPAERRAAAAAETSPGR